LPEETLKIGLFGGSFDPIHLGHLQLAQWTHKKLSLDRIVFIPAATPPHKLAIKLTDASHRLRMIRLAIKNYAGFEVSDVELKRSGISYTIDTILYFQRTFKLKKENLFVIIGADSLVDFPNWKDPDRILQNCQIVVLQRPGVELDRASPDLREQAIILPSPLIRISATAIRERVKKRLPIGNLVPEPVERYIREHGLYQ